MKRTLLALVFCSSIVSAQWENYHMYVYYPTWAVYTMPPSELKFPAGMSVTYVHFSAHAKAASPYFFDAAQGDNDLANGQRALIDSAHAHGQKVILSLTSQELSNNPLRIAVQDNAKRPVFIHAVIQYCLEKGYNGMDWDWEQQLDNSVMATFIREVRDSMNQYPSLTIQVMAVQPSIWVYEGAPGWGSAVYNVSAMNTYLTDYFTMSYVMHTAERSWGAQGAFWNCYGTGTYLAMLDCPYSYPVASWPTLGSCTKSVSYYAADFTHNGLPEWLAHGADTSKVGVGLNSELTVLTGSSGSSVLGSVISAGQTFIPYSYRTGTQHYVPESDAYWYNDGRFTSYIDSAGTYKRTKWAIDTMHTKCVMLYEGWSSHVSTGQRYGRQPHFDAMANAIRSQGQEPVSPPIITNLTVTGKTQTAATLSARFNPNGALATGQFKYGTSNPPTTTVTATQSPFATTGTGTYGLTSLSSGTKYYYQGIASNSGGNTSTSIDSFTTLSPAPVAPTVETDSVNTVGPTSAHFFGHVDDNGNIATCKFVVWQSGTTVFDTVTASESPVSGTSALTFTKTGLNPSTVYVVKAIATNSGGTDVGASILFTTLGAPTVTTNPASSIGTTSAILSVSFDAHGASTSGYVRWWPTANPAAIDSAEMVGSPVLAGSPTTLTYSVTGLTVSTGYTFDGKGINSVGTIYGLQRTFTTGTPSTGRKVIITKTIH